VAALTEAFGERGRDIYSQARGEDGRTVEPKGRPKSLSAESAFVGATADPNEKRHKMKTLSTEVAERASIKDALYRTIGIKIVEPPFEVNTRARSLSGPVDDPELIEAIALELLAEFENEPVRKLGVRLSNLSFDEREQATIEKWTSEGREPDVERFEMRQSGTGRTREQTKLARFE
jgi:DNA polymerase IV (DinB-like DNA polymerase)